MMLGLAGCASPHFTMMDSDRHEITLSGIRFVVFHKDNEAEVLRMGYLRRRERDVVPELMAEAAARTTGCHVIPNSMSTRIPGDTGEAMFDLDC